MLHLDWIERVLIRFAAASVKKLEQESENHKAEIVTLKQEHSDDKERISVLQTDLLAVRTNQVTRGRVSTLFPKLPNEIRLMIWDIALAVPQIIAVRQIARVLCNGPVGKSCFSSNLCPWLDSCSYFIGL